jgi:hypothetical protein
MLQPLGRANSTRSERQLLAVAALAVPMAAEQAAKVCGRPNADIDTPTQYLERQQHPILATTER